MFDKDTDLQPNDKDSRSFFSSFVSGLIPIFPFL